MRWKAKGKNLPASGRYWIPALEEPPLEPGAFCHPGGFSFNCLSIWVLNCFKNSVRGFSLSAALAELDSVKKKKRITTQLRMGRSLAGQLRNDGNTTKLIFNDPAGSGSSRQNRSSPFHI